MVAEQSSARSFSESAVSTEEQQHVALPKLYGAPAYARPPMPVEEHHSRPFDPDDLPITAYQTEEERHFVEELPARAWAPGGGLLLDVQDPAPRPARHMNARPFRLRALAGRLFGGES
jgi:hypothetical protein